MLPLIYDALFEIQQTLINSVAPQLRAVTVDADSEKNELVFFFFYDGEVTDELFDLASVAIAEVDIPQINFSHQHIIRLDFPKQIPIQGKLAFLRKEPILPEYQKENRTFLLKQVSPILVLLLDLQEALLGKIMPALRHVSAEIDAKGKRLGFYFIYDGEISKKGYDLAVSVIQEAKVSFPGYKIDSHIDRIDFPTEIFSHGRKTAYMRQEWKY